MIRKLWRGPAGLWDEDHSPDPVRYDPVHVAGVVVATLFALSVLFWLLWALLVYQGGLPSKALPFLRVVLTSKTFGDYAARGVETPVGVFEGTVVNLLALGIAAGLLVAVGWLVRESQRASRKP